MNISDKIFEQVFGNDEKLSFNQTFQANQENDPNLWNILMWAEERLVSKCRITATTKEGEKSFIEHSKAQRILQETLFLYKYCIEKQLGEK